MADEKAQHNAPQRILTLEQEALLDYISKTWMGIWKS